MLAILQPFFWKKKSAGPTGPAGVVLTFYYPTPPVEYGPARPGFGDRTQTGVDSDVAWDAPTVNVLFDPTPAAARAARAEYFRQVFVANTGDRPAYGVCVHLSAAGATGSLSLAADPTPAGPRLSGRAAGLAYRRGTAFVPRLLFRLARTRATAVALGTLLPGQARAFWIRLEALGAAGGTGSLEVTATAGVAAASARASWDMG